MRPPEFTGGNADPSQWQDVERDEASMRPPEFTGGNTLTLHLYNRTERASMRPPEFTGGNHGARHSGLLAISWLQ